VAEGYKGFCEIQTRPDGNAGRADGQHKLLHKSDEAIVPWLQLLSLSRVITTANAANPDVSFQTIEIPCYCRRGYKAYFLSRSSPKSSLHQAAGIVIIVILLLFFCNFSFNGMLLFFF
jgi:hypothetical protein